MLTRICQLSFRINTQHLPLKICKTIPPSSTCFKIISIIIKTVYIHAIYTQTVVLQAHKQAYKYGVGMYTTIPHADKNKAQITKLQYLQSRFTKGYV